MNKHTNMLNVRTACKYGATIAMALLLSGCFGAGSSAPRKVEINPLLAPFDTPYNIPPFDQVRDDHYLPAIEQSMALHLEQIDAIASSDQPPTFANTIVALEDSGRQLSTVLSLFYNLLSGNTNDQLDEIATQVSPLTSAHFDNIFLNARLYARVAAIHNQLPQLRLSTEQKRLVTETYKQFVRSGIALNAKDKKLLVDLNQRIAALTTKFGQNVTAETTNGYQLLITDRSDLDGLPQAVIAQAEQLATNNGHDGSWMFIPTRVSMYPFLTYSTKRDLREKLYKSYLQRANRDNEFDNKAVAKEIAQLRLRRAKLLGFKTHADYVLDDTMAQNTVRVKQLLDRVWEPALATAKQEVREMQALIDAEGGDFKLAGWDWWFYSEKIRKEKYDFSEEEVRPYFEQGAVLQGAFTVAEKLFNISFKERFDLPKFRDEIRTFEVTDDNGRIIGIFFADLTQRANKRFGAWMNSFVQQRNNVNGQRVIPVIMNTSNFPPPNEQGDILLTFEHVNTLFHEFGHALHGLLSDVNYSSLSGTNVYRDYVEFPSQVYENWAVEPEVLKLYARHYKTGEVIPQELVDKILQANTFNTGFGTTEYLAAAYLDMAWHTYDGTIEDVNAFEDKVLTELGLIPEIATRYRSTYFSHIFAGGYSMGYYSYMWTQVLDADAYVPFKENGIFDQATAQRLKKYVFSSGNSDDLLKQYIRYRGQEPAIEPLLQKLGFSDQD